MPLKKSNHKKKRTKTSCSFPRRVLKEEEIVQISGNHSRKQIASTCKKSVCFYKKSESVRVKKVLTPLDRLNLMTSSGNSRQSRSVKSNKSSKSTRQDSDNGHPINKTLFKHSNNGELKRLYSPFNKFSRNKTRNFPKMTPYQSQYSHIGLSPREKSYLICSCQSRSTRYQTLKTLAANAVRNNKIFIIDGRCNTVRKALLERGWVEKIPANKMNLTKIRDGSFSNKDDIHNELERLLLSNFVEKCPPNFIWQARGDYPDTTIDMNVDTTAVVNKLKVDATWTTKQGLCSSMKRNYWFYIENIAEVNGPRTYNSCNAGENEGFVKDFQITACTSLLKWVLSMVANERPIFQETGNISLNVMTFALNRCKEYLFSKQNKDIDRVPRTASNGQWVTFMKKYYDIIGKEDVFVADNENKLPLYLGYAKFLLKEIHKYRPQLSCEGCHNIWIIKPAHCSRGRGIRIASKLAVITNLLDKAKAKYVIQKYIEEPLLIHETKFDIRQYYLVTSTYPLVIWMYRDCYLKFSSQKYNLKNFHESIHLTNNAVQRRYQNCLKRHPDLPQNNMWDLDKYRQYLRKIGKEKVWDNIIYPGMKKSIIGIMLSCQDSLSVSKNRFELYGCDFILDKGYEPWLIEINSCPDLNPTTPVTAKMCPAVVLDIVKVVIDHAHNSKESTGKFECVYRQPMTLPRYGGALDLLVQGFALPSEYFYRGKLTINDFYGNADIEEETDIRTILDRLKQEFETDIMVEPDDDDGFEIKRDASGQNTESEYELSVAASAVNEQIDELIDRITSAHSSTTTTDLPSQALEATFSSESISKDKPEQVNSVLVTKSETGICSLLVKSASHFTSADDICVKRSFKFSELEDGAISKESALRFESLKKAIKQTSNGISESKKDHTYQELLEATTKIVSFIDKKEREHLQDLMKYSNWQ